MAKIQRFEGLQAWQKARLLTQAIDELAFTAKFARDDYLRNQIRRAAGSVMHNIAEGTEEERCRAHETANEAKPLINGLIANLRKRKN